MTTPAVEPTVDTTLLLHGLLADHIRTSAANQPRNLQTHIGPSGVGVPCDRRLGYTLLEWPTSNDDTDPMASIIGTATHTWLAEHFTNHPDFLVEQRVTVRPGLTGNTDLYYRGCGGVALDWKVVGHTALKNYKKNGPSSQYRTQVQLYGRGLANAGHPVAKVGCVFLCRTGRLSDMHVWTEDYKPAVVDAALGRLDTVLALVTALDVEHTPTAWELLPTADAHCAYCPWFAPGSTDLSTGCPGDAGRVLRPAQFAGIAG